MLPKLCKHRMKSSRKDRCYKPLMVPSNESKRRFYPLVEVPWCQNQRSHIVNRWYHLLPPNCNGRMSCNSWNRFLLVKFKIRKHSFFWIGLGGVLGVTL